MKDELVWKYKKTLEGLSIQLHNAKIDMEEILKMLGKEQTIPMDPLKDILEKMHKKIVDMSKDVDSEIRNASNYSNIQVSTGIPPTERY